MIKIPEKLYPYFEDAGTTYCVRRDGILYMQGDAAPSVYLIKQGRVRMFYTADSGKEITFQIIGAGQLIGESAFLTHASRTTNISAITDVILISCPVERLFPYMQKSRELNELVLSLLTDNYHYLCMQLRRLTVYDSYQKVAGYLLDQTEFSNAETGIIDETLPYTHEELSVCLNLNRVTVTKILNRFKEKGFVRLGHKKIQVINRMGLKKMLEPNAPEN